MKSRPYEIKDTVTISVLKRAISDQCLRDRGSVLIISFNQATPRGEGKGR